MCYSYVKFRLNLLLYECTFYVHAHPFVSTFWTVASLGVVPLITYDNTLLYGLKCPHWVDRSEAIKVSENKTSYGDK